MKHLLFPLLLLLGAFVAFAQYPTAGELSKDIKWELKDSVLTISGSGKMPGYNSTSISKLPWQDERMAAAVKKIVVKEGITEVGAYCFGARAHSRNARDPKSHTYYNTQDATTSAHFLNIEEVILPSTLTKIGAHAFVRMPLTHIHLPEGLEDISSGAFSNTALVAVILPSSLRRLGPEAFGSCVNLRAIDFANLPLKLSTGVLFGTEQLRLVMHTSKIKSIEPSAFNASSLTTFEPDELLSIFSQDGIDYYLSTYVPQRANFAGSNNEYEQLKATAIDRFYADEAKKATSLFELDRKVLLPYNPENQTFVIHTINHGDLLMKVSPEMAETLPSRWNRLLKAAQPIYKPLDGKVLLQSVNFNLGDTELVAAPIL